MVWAALGVTIARGEEHTALWGHLGIETPPRWWDEIPYSLEDLYPDALDCLSRVRELGLRVGIVGNQTEALERWARDSALPADVISSSASLGVRKPELAFFEKVVALLGHRADEVAYVGDRVDNDVLPAAASRSRRRARQARAVGKAAADTARGDPRAGRPPPRCPRR